MLLSIADQLLVDRHAARTDKKEYQHEEGKGNFPYQLTANLHGLLTFTPVFERKAKAPTLYNALERMHQDPILPTTVCRDENGARIFLQSQTLQSGKKIHLTAAPLAKRMRKNYDRKNKISETGTRLRPAAVNKIKNSILHKYYSTGGDFAGDLKFFTYTVPEPQYKQLLLEFNRTNDAIEKESTRDITRDYYPFTNLSVLKKWKDQNIHPDQYYIRHFSDHLENLCKRKAAFVESYVWTAEKTKKGVIHFHAIFETKYLNANLQSYSWAMRCGFENHWNSVQYGFDRKGKNKVDNYATGSTINPGQISSYLTKYVSKNDSEIFGRNYGMSKTFREHAVKGVEKIFNPQFKLYDKKESDKHQRGAMYFESPWTRWNPNTKQYYRPMLCLPVQLLKTGFIEIPTGKVPIYVLKANPWHLIETLFPRLWSRCEFMFKRERSQRQDYIEQLKVFQLVS